MFMEQLRQLADEAKRSALASAEVIEARRLLDGLELVWLEALGAADAQGVAAERGAASTAAWLAVPTTMRRSDAGNRVSFARKLRSMPHTAAAVHDGTLSLSQARILSRGLTPRTTEVFAEHEETLVATAAPLNASQTEFLILHWLRLADQDGAERNDGETESARRLDVRETLPGQWWIDGRCTAVQAEVLNRSVEALLSGWLRNTTDTRTLAQMRIDALVEVCRQWLTSRDTPTVRDERPHININVDLGTLTTGRGFASLDDGTPISNECLSEFLCDSLITRILSRGSIVLDVGRSERTVTKAQRKAVSKRDGGCRHAGCGRPASQCDVHHIIGWINGGASDLSNLVLLCRFHHRHLHKHRLRSELRPDATFVVWDHDGNEIRSVPPPPVGAANRRSAPRCQPGSPETNGFETDPEMRERVRDAIHCFQQSTALRTPDDDLVRQLVRRRIAALTRT